MKRWMVNLARRDVFEIDALRPFSSNSRYADGLFSFSSSLLLLFSFSVRSKTVAIGVCFMVSIGESKNENA